MGAQFSDIHSPEKHMNDFLIEFEKTNELENLLSNIP